MKRLLTLVLLWGVLLVGAAFAQTWTQVNNVPNIQANSPMLLTDGSVLVQDADNSDWWKLTPDITGSYANGTWTQLASTPNYGPLYFASAILPDGRFFTMGGEYNFGDPVWQTTGYIYDPVANAWTFQPCPTGWDQGPQAGMGDTASVTLANGQLMLADPLTNQCAIFNPLTNTFGAPFVNGNLNSPIDGNDEAGLTLLPNGSVLSVMNNPNQSQIFNPATTSWSFAGNTPASLVGEGEEIGPQVLRPDGTVICFGGGGHNCIYNTATSTWSQAPDFPSNSNGQLDCADAPACLLTNGNVLVMTSPGLFNNGVVFFEWDGTNLNPAPNNANGPGDTSFLGNMLMLPNGQVMLTDQSSSIMLYNSVGTYKSSWAPTITKVSSQLAEGQTYVISGTQFNGLSGCSAYGDDSQNFTNYPIIRLTNDATGDITYCREFNPSTMAICTGSKIVSTNFVVPLTAEGGPSTIQVVTNGIPSAPVAVNVVPPLAVTIAPTSVIGGNPAVGTVTLLNPAAAGGAVITLTSSTSDATIPPSVTVAAGKNTATFAITTVPVSANEAAKITATGLGFQGNATLTILPPSLSNLSVSPTSVTGGNSSTGTVTLNGVAPSAGVTVGLSSSSQVATVPASVIVSAGATSATFSITTSLVSAATPATITASQGNVTLNAVLTVNPATISSLTVSPSFHA